MESCEVHPWPGGKGCELFHHFHLGYLDCGGAVVPGFFESVNDLASDIEGKPFFADCGTRNVSANLFKLIAIKGFSGDSCVKRECRVFHNKAGFGLMVFVGN